MLGCDCVLKKKNTVFHKVTVELAPVVTQERSSKQIKHQYRGTSVTDYKIPGPVLWLCLGIHFYVKVSA